LNDDIQIFEIYNIVACSWGSECHSQSIIIRNGNEKKFVNVHSKNLNFPTVRCCCVIWRWANFLLIAICLAELWCDSWLLAGQRMTKVSSKRKRGERSMVYPHWVLCDTRSKHLPRQIRNGLCATFAVCEIWQANFVRLRKVYRNYEILRVERRGLISASWKISLLNPMYIHVEKNNFFFHFI